MDVNLPGMNGLEATRRILADAGASKPIVVVVLSTYEASEVGPEAEAAGAATFIAKSDFSPESLSEAWRAAAGA
jgi:CheY-like chemotaxis protein